MEFDVRVQSSWCDCFKSCRAKQTDTVDARENTNEF